MYATLLDPLFEETGELEGNIEHMYCDSLGWVTVGIGHKIDDAGKLSSAGRALPFRSYSSEEWATESEILAEFARVKQKGGDYRAARTVAKLFLSSDDRVHDFDIVLERMQVTLRKFLPDFESMPSGAQFAVISMAWNLGPNFLNKTVRAYWPNLHKQLLAGDYYLASQNCLINGRSSARNRHNMVHFLNAARAVALKKKFEDVAPNTLQISISKVEAAAKSPSISSEDAWNLQALLKKQARYTSSLDGLFGKVSQAAWLSIGQDLTVSSVQTLARKADVDTKVTA